MSDNFQKKYRTQSIRLQSWDYTIPWWYFVTICTHDQENYFGEVVDGKMQLSKIGKIVNYEWLKTIELRKNVESDEFVIMPNHFHAILVINEKIDTIMHEDSKIPEDSTKIKNSKISTEIHEYFSKISPNPNSLSAIIRGFKSAVTKSVHEECNNVFKWQPRFYDRIIRNDKELYNIRKYIQQNPLKFELTNQLPENLDL